MENVPASTSPAASRPYKRRMRNILIHKPMQREFTLVIMALLMISALAIGFVIHNTIREAAFGGGFHFGKISPYEILSEVSYQLVLRVTCILFVTLIVIGIFGVFFLHRVAGPAYRFRQAFLRLNDGEIPPRLKLREGDFFHDIAEEINQLLKTLQFERAKDELIQQKIDQILASRPPDTLLKSLKDLKATIESVPPKD